MKQIKAASTVQDQSVTLDRKFVAWISQHTELLLAVAVCIIAIWAILTSEFTYVPAIALVGAVSFFVGFTASLGVSGLLAAWFVFQNVRIHHAIDAATVMVEVFAYGCVAWLGYRHREQQRRQMEKALQSQQHTDSVVPWVVANEIRTSLAAIRFLLFPLHATPQDDTSGDSLRQATAELQRLEQIFSNIEKDEQERVRKNS